MNQHTKNQINIGNRLEIRYGKLKFSKFKGRYSLKNQWIGMKLELGLKVIKVDSYTKYQVNMFKCFEEKCAKVMFFFWTDRRMDRQTDGQSANRSIIREI